MRNLFFLPLLACLLLFTEPVKAQPSGFLERGEAVENVWVFFTDKDGVAFDPYDFFHPRAIERRLRHGQDLYDPQDYPVSKDYLSRVGLLADSTDVVLRWFNAVSVFARPSQLEQIAALPFVERIEPMTVIAVPANFREDPLLVEHLSSSQKELMEAQITHMSGQWFFENGLDGRGIRVAIFDAGFPGVDEHPVFQHIREEGRIVATRDFVRRRQDVFGKNSHGTSVMSLIGGMADSLHLGLATGAEFLLARTETWTEYFSEEKYWLEAMEWADRLGADIINSSLGYTYQRYFPEDMDGTKSLVARAAQTAFRKGILIVNAAGNDGSRKQWEVIGTPADVTEVLSAGALDYPSLIRAGYSSRGPTADGRMKPNVAALGTVVAAGKTGLKRTSGTSFASPLLAGFAACLWQKYPDWTNQQVFDAMQQSATLYPYFDYSHGFGTPQADYFFQDPGNGFRPTFDFVSTPGELKVLIHIKTLKGENEQPDRYLYYQVQDADQKILEYFVVKVHQPEVLSLDPGDFVPGQKLVVHFEGYTAIWNF
ncbi:MAG: S8 family serine peptidase [Bacteroides sp.]|jgi:hypothetical protein|nr:S8 family serine peptidase [Bacteroides sp.]